MQIREELLSLFSEFNHGKIPIQVFQDGLEELNKRGILQHLAPKERAIFNDFFTWYAGMYDPNRPPQSGLIGKLKDILAQFKGEYRVSLECFKKKALEVEKVISHEPPV